MISLSLPQPYARRSGRCKGEIGCLSLASLTRLCQGRLFNAAY